MAKLTSSVIRTLLQTEQEQKEEAIQATFSDRTNRKMKKYLGVDVPEDLYPFLKKYKRIVNDISAGIGQIEYFIGKYGEAWFILTGRDGKQANSVKYIDLPTAKEDLILLLGMVGCKRGQAENISNSGKENKIIN